MRANKPNIDAHTGDDRAPAALQITTLPIAIWCAALLAAAASLAACAPREPESLSPMQEAARKSPYAATACEEFGRQRLKSPSTAQFQPSPRVEPNYPSRGTYSVTGTVDAQNSYGAMLRAVYTCRVYQDGKGNWRLERFDLAE